MLNATAPELASLVAAACSVHRRLEVKDVDGVWKDLTNLLGVNWFIGYDIDGDIDQPVGQATFTLRRDVTAATVLSLSPLRTDSLVNRNAANAFASLVFAGRDIRYSVAVIAFGANPVAGDYHRLFEGRIDVVSLEQDPMTVTARDLGGALQDRWFKQPLVWATPDAPQPIESVLQNMLNLLFGADPIPTLYVPVSPGENVTSFKTDIESGLDGMLRLIGLIGWDLRYRWDDGTSAYRLTFMDPDRAKTVPDVTIGAGQYLDVTRLAIDGNTVRNHIVLWWGPANARQSYEIADPTSVLLYLRRFLVIQEGSDSPINSAPEAQQMGDLMLADLKDPKAEQVVELFPVFWPLELHDLARFTANGVHYNANQDLAVVKIRHVGTTSEDGEVEDKTIVEVRGKPAGLYNGWINRAGVAEPPTVPVPPLIDSTEQTAGVDANHTDVGLVVIDPQSQGGTLRVWTAPGSPNDADPSTAPDGTKVIAATPFAFDASTVFNLTGGGTGKLLEDVPVHAGRGKLVYFEFVNVAGVSSGVRSVFLRSSGGVQDSAGVLLGNIVTNAAIANLQIGATKLDGTAIQNHGVFLWTFEELPSFWLERVAGTGVESLVAGAGQAGGKAYQTTGHRWRAWPDKIAFDPSKLYRIRTRVRKTADATDPTKDKFYCGVEGIAADGVTLVNTAGANAPSGQHYVAAQFVAANAWPVNVWQEFTGWFRGWNAVGGGSPSTDPTNPKPLHTDVRYFRPVSIANFSGGNGTVQLDYIAIDVFDENGLVRTYLGLNVDGVVAANKVVAASILAGSIETGHLGANVVTASKLYLSDYANLAEDGGLEGGALGWTLQTNWAVITDGAVARHGSKFLRHDSGAIGAAKNAKITPCRGGDTYFVEGWFRGSPGTAAMNYLARIAWLGADGVTELAFANGNAITTADGIWRRSFTVATAPNTAYYVRADFVGSHTNGTGAGYADDLALRRMGEGELIVDGTITTLKLAVGSVTADRISVTSLDVVGLSRFDAAVNIRAGVQIGPNGASYNAPGTKRVIGDTSGSWALKVLKSGAEGTKAVLGDYTVTKGTAPTDRSDSSWTTATDSVGSSALFTWTASGGGAINPLTAADLPTYDGNVKITGKVRAAVASTDSFDNSVDARVRCFVSIDGGAYVDKGIIATTTAIGFGAGGGVTTTFEATVAIGSNTSTNVSIKLVAEVNPNLGGGDAETMTGEAYVFEDDASWQTVSWKQPSGGTSLGRRGLFIGRESGEPHISFEPLRAGEVPSAANLGEGELFYDGVAHAFKFFDGTSVRSISFT